MPSRVWRRWDCFRRAPTQVERRDDSWGTESVRPLGGYFAIAAVVDRFSDKIIRNPKLNKNPALKEWNKTQAKTRLPGLKFGRTLWIAAAAGGPFEYTGLPLNEAHGSSISPPTSSPKSGRRSFAHSTSTRCRNESNRNSWPPTKRACPTS